METVFERKIGFILIKYIDKKRFHLKNYYTVTKPCESILHSIIMMVGNWKLETR